MRTPITSRYRSQATSGANTTPTVMYNIPVGDVRQTIARDWSGYPGKGLANCNTNKTWDVVTQSFRGIMNRGGIVNNDYKNVKVYINQSVDNPVFAKLMYDGNGLLYRDYESHYNGWPAEGVSSGALAGLAPSPGFNIDYVIDKAVTSMHARISSAPMQSLVSLGELKQTIGLVGQLLSTTANAGKFLARAARSKAFRGNSIRTVARQLAKGPVSNISMGTASLSRQWLQYRYGIRQLYYDYSAAAKALRSLASSPRQRYSGSSTYSEDDSDETPLGLWNGMGSHTGHRSMTYKVTAEAGALVKPRMSQVGFIQAFGLDEPLQAAWDLTRFSFIVDWFINIGEKIAALAPKMDVDILASWVVVREYLQQSGYATYVAQTYSHGPNSTAYTVANWAPHMTKVTETTTRLANPAINPIPNWDIRLNVGRIADLLAILRTLPVLR